MRLTGRNQLLTIVSYPDDVEEVCFAFRLYADANIPNVGVYGAVSGFQDGPTGSKRGGSHQGGSGHQKDGRR